MIQNPLRMGLNSEQTAEPFVLFIFGVTGDLTRRKLMPALFSLFLKGMAQFRVVGFARRPWSDETFRDEAAKMLGDVSEGTEEQKREFLKRLVYLQSTFQDPEGYKRIDSFMADFHNRLYYLSTPPSSYETIIENIGSYAGRERVDGFSRIIVEKPFGSDYGTATQLNRMLSKYFREDQIFRIDHYLGKETVQNIMLLRFGNGIFEPVWNNRYIDHIQVTVAENIGVGTRANYFESAGTLRDMVQNHMLQLLSLATMEPPNDLKADSIRTEKVKVLNSIRPITYRDVWQHTVRGQYGPGVLDGAEVPGYRQEDGVADDSQTETFVALRLSLESWRWAGVPVLFRSGKRMLRKVSEIAVHFKEPPHQLFHNRHPSMNRNVLIIRIQPEEGITLHVNAKLPGHTTDMRPVNMDFAYGAAFGERTMEAYERLLFDAILGDSTLYTRRDEIEASWSFITRILEGWKSDPQPIPLYAPGSAGPEEAKALAGAIGRKWRKL